MKVVLYRNFQDSVRGKDLFDYLTAKGKPFFTYLSEDGVCYRRADHPVHEEMSFDRTLFTYEDVGSKFRAMNPAVLSKIIRMPISECRYDPDMVNIARHSQDMNIEDLPNGTRYFIRRSDDYQYEVIHRYEDIEWEYTVPNLLTKIEEFELDLKRKLKDLLPKDQDALLDSLQAIVAKHKEADLSSAVAATISPSSGIR